MGKKPVRSEPPKKAVPKIVNKGYEVVAVDSLVPNPRNDRRGNQAVVEESVEANGFYGAIVARKKTREILAGHTRWRSAKKEGLDKVPVIWVDVDDATALRILAVDNRSNDLATYDKQAQFDLLSALKDTGSLIGTGYTDLDITELEKSLAALPDPKKESVSFVASSEKKHRCPRCEFQF